MPDEIICIFLQKYFSRFVYIYDYINPQRPLMAVYCSPSFITAEFIAKCRSKQYIGNLGPCTKTIFLRICFLESIF